MVGLDRHRDQLLAVVEPGERRDAYRAVHRPPGHRADRLLGFESIEGRPAHRLDPGHPGHLAEITGLGQPGQGGLALVELRRLDGNRPQHRERLVPHLIVAVGPRDTADRRGVRQPGHGRQPHPRLGVLGRNGREHVLGIILQAVHGRRPHRRILVLPTRLATQSVKQTHEAVWSRSDSGGPRGRRSSPAAPLDSVQGNYAYSGPKVADHGYRRQDRATSSRRMDPGSRYYARLDLKYQILDEWHQSLSDERFVAPTAKGGPSCRFDLSHSS